MNLVPSSDDHLLLQSPTFAGPSLAESDTMLVGSGSCIPIASPIHQETSKERLALRGGVRPTSAPLDHAIDLGQQQNRNRRSELPVLHPHSPSLAFAEYWDSAAAAFPRSQRLPAQEERPEPKSVFEWTPPSSPVGADPSSILRLSRLGPIAKVTGLSSTTSPKERQNRFKLRTLSRDRPVSYSGDSLGLGLALDSDSGSGSDNDQDADIEKFLAVQLEDLLTSSPHFKPNACWSTAALPLTPPLRLSRPPSRRMDSQPLASGSPARLVQMRPAMPRSSSDAYVVPHRPSPVLGWKSAHQMQRRGPAVKPSAGSTPKLATKHEQSSSFMPAERRARPSRPISQGSASSVSPRVSSSPAVKKPQQPLKPSTRGLPPLSPARVYSETEMPSTGGPACPPPALDLPPTPSILPAPAIPSRSPLRTQKIKTESPKTPALRPLRGSPPRKGTVPNASQRSPQERPPTLQAEPEGTALPLLPTPPATLPSAAEWLRSAKIPTFFDASDEYLYEDACSIMQERQPSIATSTRSTRGLSQQEQSLLIPQPSGADRNRMTSTVSALSELSLYSATSDQTELAHDEPFGYNRDSLSSLTSSSATATESIPPSPVSVPGVMDWSRYSLAAPPDTKRSAGGWSSPHLGVDPAGFAIGPSPRTLLTEIAPCDMSMMRTRRHSPIRAAEAHLSVHQPIAPAMPQASSSLLPPRVAGLRRTSSRRATRSREPSLKTQNLLQALQFGDLRLSAEGGAEKSTSLAPAALRKMSIAELVAEWRWGNVGTAF